MSANNSNAGDAGLAEWKQIIVQQENDHHKVRKRGAPRRSGATTNAAEDRGPPTSTLQHVRRGAEGETLYGPRLSATMERGHLSAGTEDRRAVQSGMRRPETQAHLWFLKSLKAEWEPEPLVTKLLSCGTTFRSQSGGSFGFSHSSQHPTHTCEELLSLRGPSLLYVDKPVVHAEIRRKRRGCRGGRKKRLQQDGGLAALTRQQREYQECSLMCFSETWLNGLILDSVVSLNRFTQTGVGQSAFDTIRPALLGEAGGVEWIWLPGPSTTSLTVHNSCHLQKFSDYSTIVGCVSAENKLDYQSIIMDFVYWCAEQQHVGSATLDISSCPITYYGEQYTTLYVTATNESFTACFDSSSGVDCIEGPPVDDNTFYFEETSDNETHYHQNLPYIFSPLICSVELSGFLGGLIFSLTISSFGSQAAVKLEAGSLGPHVFEFVVNDASVGSVSLTNTGPIYKDISACRQSGVVYNYGEQVSSDPDTCSTESCDSVATIQPDGCHPLERCHGNNTCILDPICTVTGPAVIDFYGQLNYVEDRCGYNLLTGSSIQNLTVVANFRERRRRDVSFLDSVTLRLQGQDDVHLEQGGIVKEGNTVLTINGSTDLGNGVEVFVDPTGVTARVTIGSNTVSVFFDGNTAQIFLEGPGGQEPQLDGLCVNSMSLSDERRDNNSTIDCEVQYNDTADSSIDCTAMTERCNLLLEEPFTACHNHTDPESYVNACIDTLCKYPAVDGLNCQFLEAYARHCSLRSINILDSWRSTAGCSPPQPFCQGRICSDHEFCAETISGGIGCFCRAIFAFPYRSNDTLVHPTVCEENSASVTLVGCLLEEKGIDYTMLHLNDPTCTGQRDELDHMVTFSFNGSNTCGTEVMANNSQLIYMNTITVLNSSSDNITREDQVYIDFSCVFIQPDVNTVTFRIKDSSVIEKITSGTWNYTLTMKAYTDAGRTQAVDSNTEVQLNQQIWMELETDGLDDGLVALVTDSCWATDQAESLRYNLIVDGCANPDDQTVNVVGNGEGTSSYFSFNMFQFSRSSSEVSVHCKVNLCASLNQTCTPDCSGGLRKRRSAGSKYLDEAPAFISMTWTN
ncbi:uncharacterized protein LOC121626990 [Chelmon rostratus]|uniref:uncharacterized protein LOC121626990 n=1 Tax=Chelmon rostratus TaxID=109905 RepID=UPI001BEACADA|nr:uncharacterized protein LOC121626990 [Chelmon rostratus]